MFGLRMLHYDDQQLINSRAVESGLIDEAVVDGVEGQFEAVRDAELIEDIVEVVLYSLLADEELLADFAVAETLSHELDDFLFAIAQQRLFPALARF